MPTTTDTREQVTTNQLTWNKKTKTFSGEASTLGFRPGYFPAIITILNPDTGKSVNFYKPTQDRQFGELFAVKYVGVTPQDYLHLTVFND